MKTIQRKYETGVDRSVEIELGGRYVRCHDTLATLENLPYLSTYDFKVFKNGQQVAWLEVKRKTGNFSYTEIIPITKWWFAQKSELPCLFLVERWNKAMLFNVSDLVARNLGREVEITRRADQPEGSRKVVRFSTNYGRVIYYL